MTAGALLSPVIRPASTIEAARPAIVAEDVVKVYRGGVRALDGVSLTVGGGTIFGLLGPNGAGKSTMVKILATLSRADSGRAEVAGIDVGRHPNRVRRVIGLVGQQGAVDSEATGRENLILQGHLYGLGGSELGRRADDLLDRFGLTDAAGRIVKTWSGGMRRKLDVASGLVHEPSVLFLDEPTTGLDPEARAELWSEIERLAAGGLTILLTTHYLEEADRLARQVAIIDRGRIVARGTPDDLKAELHGDAIVVELGDADVGGDATRALSSVPGVRGSFDRRPHRARPGR